MVWKVLKCWRGAATNLAVDGVNGAVAIIEADTDGLDDACLSAVLASVLLVTLSAESLSICSSGEAVVV